MSGDVQPRKRKDKKRKKDEVEQSLIPPQAPAPQVNQNNDVNIHVQKETGTGGNICSKIIFIVLSSALIVLIGLIITEYRGLTDLDTTTDSESRFAQVFEGWVENSAAHHDDHDDIEDIIASHEEEDDHNNEDDDLSVEHDDDEDDDTQTEEPSEELADEDDEGTEENDDEDDEETQEDVDEQTREEDDDDDDDDETDENKDVSDEKEENVSEDDTSQPVDSQEADDNEENEEEDDDAQLDDSTEKMESEEADQEELSKEKEASEEQDETGDVDEPESNEDENEVLPEKKKQATTSQTTIPDEENNETSGSNVLVKVGVGIAILLVAHIIFIRKWKSAPGEVPISGDDVNEPMPDLSRRNTIVPPPSLQEIMQDIENDEEEFSDEEGSYDEDEVPIEHKSAKEKYQDLRSSYSRSLTPESDDADNVGKQEHCEEEEIEDDEDEEDDDDEEEAEEEWERETESDGYNDEDDEELLKRLEAKYGKLANVKQNPDDDLASWERVNPIEGGEELDKQSDDEAYEQKDLTSKQEIDETHKSIENNAAYAIKRFDAILEKFPNSLRSLYGKAVALDKLADERRSNKILQQAIDGYSDLLNNPNTPPTIFQLAANRCINRLRFLGEYNKAISVHTLLIGKYPNNTKYLNQLVVTYLTINRISDARKLLKNILKKFPNDGLALVHYGFILKTSDNKLEEGVHYLKRGIETSDPGVFDGRFFFHLGDALARLGKNDEATTIYEKGVQHGLFLSKYQRSLYNVQRLTAKPWWKEEDIPFKNLLNDLKNNWKKIQQEGLSVLSQKHYFKDELENLRDKGDWKQFELFARGRKNAANCQKCPTTCQIIERNPEARLCKRGQSKFSVMHPGTHVWSHCGPTNCRLRVHLGLKVPTNTYIRVADEIRSWKEGEILIFDDSFEHEVWHNGSDFRLVLIVDIWHPELTQVERQSLSPI